MVTMTARVFSVAQKLGLLSALGILIYPLATLLLCSPDIYVAVVLGVFENGGTKYISYFQLITILFITIFFFLQSNRHKILFMNYKIIFSLFYLIHY